MQVRKNARVPRLGGLLERRPRKTVVRRRAWLVENTGDMGLQISFIFLRGVADAAAFDRIDHSSDCRVIDLRRYSTVLEVEKFGEAQSIA